MLGWLADNLATVIVCAVLILVVGCSIAALVRRRRQGKSSCGCGCEGCDKAHICQKDA